MADETSKPASPADEIAELKSMMERMQERLAELSAAADRTGDIQGTAQNKDASIEKPEDVAADDGVSSEEEANLVEAARTDEATADAVLSAEVDVQASEVADNAAAEPVACGGKADHAAASAESAASSVRVEPVPEATDAFPAQERAASRPQTVAPQGYAAYVPPARSEPAFHAAPFQHAGAPTPPPAYDAPAAYAQRQAVQTARVEYTQPTGQQAYQSNGAYANGFNASSQMPYNPYGQNYYQQPVVRTKDHVAAGLLGIFLGAFGIHKFYLGYNTAGFIMLGVAILGGLLSLGLATGVIWLIGLIEGIIYLVKSQSEFEQAYVFGKREWF